jgi:hypothetical protein
LFNGRITPEVTSIMRRTLVEILEKSNAPTARLTVELGVFGPCKELTRNAKGRARELGLPLEKLLE